MKLTKVISRNALSGGRNGRWGITLLIALLAMAAQTAWAGSEQFPIYTDDKGTETEPYQIKTIDDLNKLAADVNSGTSYGDKYFKLVNDLTFSYTTAWNSTDAYTSNFTPIGDSNHPFRGHFDGDGHTISGIRINSTAAYQGLFGWVYNYSEVKNVNIADARIAGGQFTGGIAGVSGSNNTITNCHVCADVAIVANSSSYGYGGIAGLNNGTVSCCSSGVKISVASGNNPRYLGGIVGCNSSTNSTNKATLTGNFVVGAIIPAANYGLHAAIAVDDNYTNSGSNHHVHYDHNYYWDCKVAETTNATNVGITTSESSSSSPTGDINTTDNPDGAVYKAPYTLTVGAGVTATSNPASAFSGTSYYCLEGATVTLSGQQSEQTPVGSFYEGYAVNGTAIGGNSFEMPAEDVTVTSNIIHCYTLTLADGITAEATPTITVGSTPYYRPGTTVTLSGRPSESGYIYPYLLNGIALYIDTFTMPASDVTVTVGERVADWDSGSNGSSEGTAYQIKTTVDLDLLAQRVNSGTNYNGKYFKLMNDIAYTHTTAWNDATSTENNYTAIGNNAKFFGGTFDGDGHTISGIRIYKGGNSDQSDSYQGLFGHVGNSSTVKNLTLADARITGYNNVGGIAGNNGQGTITYCCVAADVALHAVQGGAGKFGGIVGNNNYGTVSYCTSGVKITVISGITSFGDLGGIVGHNFYDNSKGTITYSHAIGVSIPANGYAGAIVGYYHVSKTSDNPLSGSNNTYHSCLVGTKAFNIGLGQYDQYDDALNHTTFQGDGNGASLDNTKFYLDDYMDARALIAAYADPSHHTAYSGATPDLSNVTATLSRTFPAGKKQTICLPFPPVELLDKGTLWEFTAISGTTATMTAVGDANNLQANTPYIFQATNEVKNPEFSGVSVSYDADPKKENNTDNFTFHGTYAEKTWETDDPAVTSGHLYGFMMKDNDGQTEGQFVKARRKTILRPFSCYLEYNGNLDGTSTSSARRRATESLPDVIDIVWKSADGTVTGISTLDTRTGEITDYGDAWYSIDGRRLSGKPTAKGIYIKNGKKSIVK